MHWMAFDYFVDQFIQFGLRSHTTHKNLGYEKALLIGLELGHIVYAVVEIIFEHQRDTGPLLKVAIKGRVVLIGKIKRLVDRQRKYEHQSSVSDSVQTLGVDYGEVVLLLLPNVVP